MTYTKPLLYCFVGILLALQSTAQDEQWQEIIENKVPDEYKLTAGLYQVAAMYDYYPDYALNKAASMGIILDSDLSLTVVIHHVNTDQDPPNTDYLLELGLEVNKVKADRARCQTFLFDILELSSSLPPNHIMLQHIGGINLNQGPSKTNTTSYQSNGFAGQGVKIAIMDGGFEDLSIAQDSNVVPQNIAEYDWTVIPGDKHGTACLEMAFDHSPAATYSIHQIYDPFDLDDAIDQAIDNGVDIISHSRGYPFTGWEDNNDFTCEDIEDANAAGMLFFQGSGNHRQKHWQGFFQDEDGDSWHNWVSTDEGNNFTLKPDETAIITLEWAAAANPLNSDYDMEVVNANTGSVIATANSGWTHEILFVTSFSSSDIELYIRVIQDGVINYEFELFYMGIGNLQHTVNENSSLPPANCTYENVVVVGAVYHDTYNDDQGTGAIESYSSEGPSNDGYPNLDLCAPTGTYSVVYGGGFSGTSCATPNAAGAAAALWSAMPNYSSAGIRQVINRTALIYNDWGSSGYDHVHGNGGLYLNDYLPSMQYILSSSGNTSSNLNLPFLSTADAAEFAPIGSNIYYLDMHYTISRPTILARAMTFRTLYQNGTVVE